MDAAKRYRVNTEKIHKAVAEDFAAKRKRKNLCRKENQSGSRQGLGNTSAAI